MARPAPCFDRSRVDAFLVREPPVAYGTAPDERPDPPAGAPGSPTPATGDVGPEPATPATDAESVPDPFTDADALGELEHELTTLAAHIAAATHRFLLLLADFDRRRGWELGGHRSCAHWLQVATAMKLHTAREKVRVARKLVGLPKTSEAMSRGELSFSQVRELSRVATSECEEELIEYAKNTTVSELERFVRMWRTMSRADDEALERARYRLRRFSVVPDDEGMYVVRGRVTAEVGAVLMRAIDAAGDALFSAEAKDETTPKQRRADALGLVAERALAVGFGGEGEDVPRGTLGRSDASMSAGGAEAAEDVPHGTPGRMDTFTGGTGRSPSPESGSHEPRGRSDDGTGEESCGEEGATGSPAPLSGSRAERYQVMLHVKAEGAHLEDGTGVPAGTSRRLCCDSSVVTVRRDADGSVLDVGRRTRTIPPALRRALEVRDNGCRFPGCGLRFTDGHHLEHWQDGGETRLDNLLLLCRYHHRLVHEGGWRVEFWGRDRHAAFVDPNGGIHIDPERPTPDLPDNAADSLVSENKARDVHPTGWVLWTEHARAADIPYSLRARAVEALDQAYLGV